MCRDGCDFHFSWRELDPGQDSRLWKRPRMFLSDSTRCQTGRAWNVFPIQPDSRETNSNIFSMEMNLWDNNDSGADVLSC